MIDFTTDEWELSCREVIGMKCLAPLPPEFLWTFGAVCRTARGTAPTETPSTS